MNQLRSVISISLAVVFAVVLFSLPPVAEAQEQGQEQGVGGLRGLPESSPEGPRTFGTASGISHTIQAYAFDPFAGDGFNFGGTIVGSRFCTSECFFEAPLMLPAGARVSEVEMEACDFNFFGAVTVRLFRLGLLESAFPTLAQVTSSTVGCATTSAFPLPFTIDNFNNSYLVEVQITGGTSATRFQAVRVYYNLQVSPAPAVATFTDVPTTHSQFRFVEALAASGITSGCGGGNYCPNDPVTRGQMAVFLSRALGLHFAP